MQHLKKDVNWNKMTHKAQNQLIYFVSGMWCATCAKSVREAVSKVEGVKSADINYASKLLSVEVIEQSQSRNIDETIQSKIRQIGFGVKKQVEGWLGGFQKELEKDSENKMPWLLVSIVWFLAMWASMIAFAGYSGGRLSSREVYLIALGSSMFGLPAILLGIYPYAVSGLRALIYGRLLTLDLFIFFGGLSAMTVSIIYLSTGEAISYADSGSMIIALLLLTKKIENSIINKMTASILFQLHPAQNKVRVWKDQEWKPAEAHQIKRGQSVRVFSGETIPFDGVIESPKCIVNNHLLSGESTAISLCRGDHVFAGAIAATDLEICVTNSQGNRKIDEWAESALIAKKQSSYYSKLFSKIESSLTVIAFLGAGVLALIAWHNGSTIKTIVEAFFVGILIFCPCLFASIIPLSKQMAHLALLKVGVIIYRSDALLDLAHIKNIYFDKTGTLEAVESIYFPIEDSENIDSYLSELSQKSQHPILRGLLKDQKQRGSGLIKKIDEIPGKGSFAWTKDNKLFTIGSKLFLASEGIEIPDATISTSYVAFNNRLVGQIISKKSYDESSLKFIKSLVKNFSGYRIGVLSGDPSFAGQERFESTFENVSYFGNLSPEDKAYKIKPKSIFVGDGLNDTLAFAKADVSIRLGHRILGYGPVDIEIKVPNLNLILRVLDYAGSYRTVLKQNAAAALLYNAIALSLAAMEKFSPLGAVVAMIISFLALLFNSLRLLSVPEV
ncbi:MAG: hypothetical protein CL676_00510 [Bdellovibrionaceae bacterium]|nr:hypothetical protein [Pseudobdellovibrionaceae bacterium]|tara:strand:- start:1553 stop:3739 length:2187 start_codon:yes stop_codon:yes gene_type:complete